jgi:pimeloyl-ACP methyl ester carboxylesterase
MNAVNINLNPVVLIPGITGTRLKTARNGKTDYELWVNFRAIMKNRDGKSLDEVSEMDLQSLRALVGWEQPEHEILDRLEDLALSPSKWWLEEMSLNSQDGMTPLDTPSYNIPQQGLEAIANLDPNSWLKDKTKYFSSLIDALKAKGYTDSNLKAAPYDWRTAPKGLIDRYDYFNNLQQMIEQLYSQNNSTPVVIIAHSMGNRITQYLLQFIKNNQKLGQAWIDKYIARYIAVSPPWLGAAIPIRQVITDSYKIGPFLLKNMKKVLQSYGAMPWVFPVTEAQYQYFNTQSFAFLNNDSHPLSIKETLQKGGASSTHQYLTQYYVNDKNYSGDTDVFGSCAVECPPVKNLDVFYGTGLDTEVGAYYSDSHGELSIDLQAKCAAPNLTVQNGIRLESVKRTKQAIDGTINSGDGTVPYGSLVYFKKWQNTNPQTQIEGYNFPNYNHTTILLQPSFIGKVLSLLGIKNIL